MSSEPTLQSGQIWTDSLYVELLLVRRPPARIRTPQTHRTHIDRRLDITHIARNADDVRPGSDPSHQSGRRQSPATRGETGQGRGDRGDGRHGHQRACEPRQSEPSLVNIVVAISAD